jgi:hypothetical protein
MDLKRYIQTLVTQTNGDCRHFYTYWVKYNAVSRWANRWFAHSLTDATPQ